jgi:hypothetical protein
LNHTNPLNAHESDLMRSAQHPDRRQWAPMQFSQSLNGVDPHLLFQVDPALFPSRLREYILRHLGIGASKTVPWWSQTWSSSSGANQAAQERAQTPADLRRLTLVPERGDVDVFLNSGNIPSSPSAMQARARLQSAGPRQASAPAVVTNMAALASFELRGSNTAFANLLHSRRPQSTSESASPQPDEPTLASTVTRDKSSGRLVLPRTPLHKMPEQPDPSVFSISGRHLGSRVHQQQQLQFLHNIQHLTGSQSTSTLPDLPASDHHMNSYANLLPPSTPGGTFLGRSSSTASLPPMLTPTRPHTSTGFASSDRLRSQYSQPSQSQQHHSTQSPTVGHAPHLGPSAPSLHQQHHQPSYAPVFEQDRGHHHSAGYFSSTPSTPWRGARAADGFDVPADHVFASRQTPAPRALGFIPVSQQKEFQQQLQLLQQHQNARVSTANSSQNWQSRTPSRAGPRLNTANSTSHHHQSSSLAKSASTPVLPSMPLNTTSNSGGSWHYIDPHGHEQMALSASAAPLSPGRNGQLHSPKPPQPPQDGSGTETQPHAHGAPSSSRERGVTIPPPMRSPPPPTGAQLAALALGPIPSS